MISNNVLYLQHKTHKRKKDEKDFDIYVCADHGTDFV